MTRQTVVLELSLLEAAHLTDLVEQFAELLADTAGPVDDPAVARLVPDAYRDDPAAAREFRSLTEQELLDRRAADAGIVIASLLHDGERLSPGRLDASDAERALTVVLDPERSSAWLRTLAAVRLVLASRLDIRDEDDHDAHDPRFGIYDWLGSRLDGLVRALDA